jgi:hypothetical protein
VGTHEAESNGEHLNDILSGDLWAFTAIGGQPEENTVNTSNSELKTGNSHWESSLSTSSVQGKLVGDVVLEYIIKAKSQSEFFSKPAETATPERRRLITYVVVTKVPEKEVDRETNIDSSLGRRGSGGLSSTDRNGIRSFVESLEIIVREARRKNERQ